MKGTRVVTTSINWPALIAAVAQAVTDVRANRPLAPQPAATGAQIAAALTAAQADIGWVAVKIAAYPGVIRGLDDVLAALDGQPWAVEVKAAVDALPGGLAEAEKWLPTVLGMLTMFSPATGGPWLGAPNAI